MNESGFFEALGGQVNFIMFGFSFFLGTTLI